MSISRKFREIYFTNGGLSDAEMLSSRKISVFEGCTARSILTLTGGAFLVGFAKYLGADEQIAGIIGAIPVLAGIITAFSPIVYERMQSRKLITCLFCFIGRFLLGLMLFIPFIRVSNSAQITLLIITFLVSNLFLAFTIPASQTWILAITPERIRGTYFGKRESIILGAVTLITLLMGQVLDRYDKVGQQFTGFIILYAFVIIAAVINFVLFSSMKEPRYTLSEQHISVADIFSLPLKNNKYMVISLIMIFWYIGFQLAAPFTSVYMVSKLGLGYGIITVMAVLASITSVVSVRFWGRLADKKSWLYLLKLMMGIQTLCFLTWFLINDRTVYLLLPLAHILSGAAISGINISINNIQYKYAPIENKTVYMGFSSAVNGILGFIGTLAGSYFLKFTQNYSNSVLGLEIGNIQLIFILAGFVLTLGILISNRVMKDGC